jgi:hypothetical protein
LDLDEALLTYGWDWRLTRLAGREQDVDVEKVSSSVKSSAPFLPLDDKEENEEVRNFLGGVATPPRSVGTLLGEGIPCEDMQAKEAEAFEDAAVLHEFRIAAELEDAFLQDDEREPSWGSRDYVVSVTAKHRLRRLHRVGMCWQLPGIDYSNFRVLFGEPGAADFDLCCKECWSSGLRVGPRSDLGGGEPIPLLVAMRLEVGLQVVLQDDLERDINETSSSSSGEDGGLRRSVEEDSAEASA